MSEHTWTREHVAAFVAGGLTADEAERLEAHVRDCAACAAELSATRQLDHDMTTLFAPVRPGPALEDRAVLAFRHSRAAGLTLSDWGRRALATAAGIGFLGGIGAIVMKGGLPLPGESREATISRIHRESGGEVSDKDLTNEDPGLESNLAAALPDSERLRQGVRIEGNTVTGDRVIRNRVESGYGVHGILPPPDGAPAPAPDVQFDQPRPARGAYDIGPAPAPAKLTGDNRQLFSFYTGLFGGDGGSHYFKPGDTQPMPGPPAPAPAPPASVVPPVTPTSSAPEQKPAVTEPKPSPAPADPQPVRRVVIRSGDIEFEVESFDSALAAVTKLVTGIPGAFVGTVNSEKLPNGKVKGSITVRTPPDHLDGLVLDLRKELGKGGELKGVRIGSQDITKQYTDLESRLRAARTMEQRLLQIIKEGKGEIKQLLEAERELGVWRTKIEEVEGELRYYGNLVALSTLNITLAEKEIRAAAGLTENERVRAGVEVEDVDAAFRQLMAAVTEAKGRVTKSELKQLTAGQLNALLHFEVAPDAAGPLRDRLRQLGRVARLEIDRVQQAAAGTPTPETKVKRGDTVFQVQLYNIANIAPREVATLQLAVPDVPAAYQTLRDAVAKTTGRVVVAQLNEQDRQNVTAQLDFEVRRADEGAVRAALAAAGEVLARQVVRAPESDNVTDAKVLYRATLVAAAKLKPRESTTMAVEVANVEQTVAAFTAWVTEANGRQLDTQTGRDRAGHVTAKLVFEVPLTAAAGLVERFKGAGVVRTHQTARDPQAPEGKYATARVEVSLSNAEQIVAADDGLWPPVRRGLAYSATVLLTSVTWVVFGLCVVLPWAVVGYGGYRAVRWATRKESTPAA